MISFYDMIVCALGRASVFVFTNVEQDMERKTENLTKHTFHTELKIMAVKKN